MRHWAAVLLLLLGCSSQRSLPTANVALASVPASDPPIATRAKTSPIAHPLSFRDEHALKPAQGSCTEHIDTFQLAGLANRSIERDINRLFSPQKLAVLVGWDRECPLGPAQCVPSKTGRLIGCRSEFGAHDLEATTRATVKHVDDRLLSVELTSAGNAGGVHPFYSVSGINVDLDRGTIHGIDDWLTDEADTIEWQRLGVRVDGDEDEPEPFYDLSAFEVARVDAPELGAYSEAYFDADALYLIPSVPEVSRHERGLHRRVPWREIAAYVPNDSPLRALVDRAP